MHSSDIKQHLEARLPGTRIEIEGEGCSFQLNVISDDLAALRPVPRQQAVYAELQSWFADGSLHAISMKFFSHEQWAARA